MAVTHSFGRPHNGEPDRTAEALACVCIRGESISFLLMALIREIDWPHRGAIHVQFEDIGSSVMPAHIELPT